MTTSQVVGRREESTVRTTPVEDLESELFFSDREAGVACFVDADEVDEDG
jgi:hypothetical protein